MLLSLALLPFVAVAVERLDAVRWAGRRVRTVPSKTIKGRLVFTADVAAAKDGATFLYEIVSEQ